MFTIPGILALLLLEYVRPAEFIPALQRLPILYLSLALVLFGFVLDLRLRRLRPLPVPQLGLVAAFIAWSVLTVALKVPDDTTRVLTELLIAATFFVLVAHGVQSFRSFQVVVGWVLMLTLFLAFVGAHQGVAHFGCHVMDEDGTAEGVYDGRECEDDVECYDGGEPGSNYKCERAGLFGTFSVAQGTRVRYRGSLNDPNELALVIAVGLPFAFAFFERRRSAARLALLALSLLLVGLCSKFTGSRGGQLVFLSVIGAYAIRKYGLRGLWLGAAVALPMLLIGGASRGDAESSSLERLECWSTGMQLFRGDPIFGVGAFHFVDHHFLTAHNSFVLAAAEIGFPGLMLWTSVLYVSLKIPLRVLQRYGTGLERIGGGAQVVAGRGLGRGEAPADPGGPGAGPAVARTWAMAVVASMVGMIVGVFFLSFCYKRILWIYIGITGALYSAVRTHDPDFRVELDRRDLLRLALINLGVIVLITLYTRLKLS